MRRVCQFMEESGLLMGGKDDFLIAWAISSVIAPVAGNVRNPDAPRLGNLNQGWRIGWLQGWMIERFAVGILTPKDRDGQKPDEAALRTLIRLTRRR